MTLSHQHHLTLYSCHHRSCQPLSLSLVTTTSPPSSIHSIYPSTNCPPCSANPSPDPSPPPAPCSTAPSPRSLPAWAKATPALPRAANSSPDRTLHLFCSTRFPPLSIDLPCPALPYHNPTIQHLQLQHLQRYDIIQPKQVTYLLWCNNS